MTLLPRPPLRRRPMPAAAFNRTVRLVPSNYPLTTQGGANPTPAAGWSFRASVQPSGGSARDVRLGGGAIPQSTTGYDVLIAYGDEADPIVKALQLGDSIEVDDGSILSVQAPAKDNGGVGRVWHIPCELVT